ncbi:hypothetical protein CAXC1_320042 [Candidatus Xenohaliotis californiensis]|uniref:Uncharacterized protein n=1 Tax=Candidatus Xenohaliotis californiensis TaxID=84677 RepID=A0ABP0ET99_9RICK|nr:hypothetical protein CAXC1_320042 [Candidatus Xenohaliotis californiensis]
MISIRDTTIWLYKIAKVFKELKYYYNIITAIYNPYLDDS